MSEHRIRLRGPWEAVDLDATSGEPFRLSLPIDRLGWSASRHLRLIRKFGRPRPSVSPATGTRLRLALEDVEGLRALFLNGEPLVWRFSDSGGVTVDLPPLRERNALLLEADIAPATPGETTLWGNVAIAISE